MERNKPSDPKWSLPPETPVYCEGCDWKGKLEECIVKWETEGWEYPEFQITVCPECDEGIQYY